MREPNPKSNLFKSSFFSVIFFDILIVILIFRAENNLINQKSIKSVQPFFRVIDGVSNQTLFYLYIQIYL